MATKKAEGEKPKTTRKTTTARKTTTKKTAAKAAEKAAPETEPLEVTVVEEETALVQVVSLPVFTEQMEAAAANIQKIVENAKALVPSGEGSADLKNTRADLNKRRKAYEEVFKAVKAQAMAPIDALEARFKELIDNPLAEADAALKEKITEVDDKAKGEKLNEGLAYFAQRSGAMGIPEGLVTFADAGVKITLSTSSKAIHEAVDALLSKVSFEIEAIKRMPSSAEIMAEYRETKDFTAAVANVQERHSRIAAEEPPQEAPARLEDLPRYNQTPAPTPAQQAVATPPQGEYHITMRVYGTVPQLQELSAWLTGHGYRFENAE